VLLPDAVTWEASVGGGGSMREGIHPEYREVVFRDAASGQSFKTRSTMSSSQTVEWEDGKTYPLVVVDISSASHPFWTGNQRVLDTAGRVERFRQRYGGQERPIRKK
jgi:large subunit ribosomal protein L31